MPRIFFLLVTSLFFSHLNAQEPFQKMSFEAALTKAKAENKLVFLQVESENCKQCNEVADRAFRDAVLVEQLKIYCVSIKVPANDLSWEEVRKKFNAKGVSGSLFIDNNGVLLHRYNGTTSLPAAYMDHIKIARSKQQEAVIYYEYEKNYREGNRNPAFLKQYLAARKKLNLNTDTLLDEYTSLLPPDSLSNAGELRFIVSMAPLLGSFADTSVRKKQELFNQAWFSLPLQERININNSVITRSLNVAIEKKDKRAAQKVATFAALTHTHPSMRLSAYEKNLLDYYKAVNDTNAYLPVAVNYYDRSYMHISVDSIKKIDSLALDQVLRSSPKDTLFTGEGTYIVRSSVIVSHSTQRYSSALNNAAWSVYTFSNDRFYMDKALTWAKRANEFFETPQSLDTYARILYRLNRKQEGIEQQERAINRARKVYASTAELEAVLAKMKNDEKL